MPVTAGHANIYLKLVQECVCIYNCWLNTSVVTLNLIKIAIFLKKVYTFRFSQCSYITEPVPSVRRPRQPSLANKMCHTCSLLVSLRTVFSSVQLVQHQLSFFICSLMAVILVSQSQAWEQYYCEKIQKFGSKLSPSNDGGGSYPCSSRVGAERLFNWMK